MDGSTTLTLRLPTKLKKDLERLADSRDRSKSHLAVKVLSDFVAEEKAIAADIKQAREEFRSGKVKFIPHKKAMARLRATVEKIARSKR